MERETGRKRESVCASMRAGGTYEEWMDFGIFAHLDIAMDSKQATNNHNP